MAEHRSKSRERRPIIKGAISQEEAQRLVQGDKEVQTKVVAIYNQQHADADLELVSYTTTDGLLILKLKYNFLSSLRDFDRLLNSVLIQGSKERKALTFDYKWNSSEDLLTVFVPLSDMFTETENKSKSRKSRKFLLMVLLVLFLILIYLAQLRLQYVLF